MTILMPLKICPEDYVIYFDSEADLEKHASEKPMDVLFALVIRNTDAAGNFPPGSGRRKRGVRHNGGLGDPGHPGNLSKI